MCNFEKSSKIANNMLKLQVLSLLKAFNVKISDNLLLNFFTFLHMFYTKKVNPFVMETVVFFKIRKLSYCLV